MVAMVRAGVELAFEAMVEAGIEPESAYYESLHETPLIANTIARKKLYEMNRVISDTAEYGCYLFSHACLSLFCKTSCPRLTPASSVKVSIQATKASTIKRSFRSTPSSATTKSKEIGIYLREAMGRNEAHHRLDLFARASRLRSVFKSPRPHRGSGFLESRLLRISRLNLSKLLSLTPRPLA
jgi:ketol-acid reductoisomerase